MSVLLKPPDGDI